MEVGKSYLATVAPVVLPAETSDTGAFSPWVISYIKSAVCDHFGFPWASARFCLLTGSYGASTNIKLEIAGNAYVLRVMKESESLLTRDTELHAMREAAAVGVAPAVRWVSPDGYAILIDYIEGGTLTFEEGKRAEVVDKIAGMMRKVHGLQKNPFYAPSFEGQMEGCYLQFLDKHGSHTIFDDAIAIIREGASLLQSLNAPMVNTHGDLHPRNVLASGQEIYFVDWADGIYTDPFQDLAFFSIAMDYDPKEEAHFVQHYLGHAPTIGERRRFQIAKKMNFARLALSGQDIGMELGSEQKENTFTFLKEWSYYAETFVNGSAPLTSQFFLGLAQVALKSAESLDVNP